MAAEPLPRTFFSQSVRLPYGRAIKKLSSCLTAITGVSYVRPDRRPTWRTTDVLDPSLPADFKASGRMARVNKRKAFWTATLMPPHSQQVEARSRAEGHNESRQEASHGPITDAQGRPPDPPAYRPPAPNGRALLTRSITGRRGSSVTIAAG